MTPSHHNQIFAFLLSALSLAACAPKLSTQVSAVKQVMCLEEKLAQGDSAAIAGHVLKLQQTYHDLVDEGAKARQAASIAAYLVEAEHFAALKSGATAPPCESKEWIPPVTGNQVADTLPYTQPLSGSPEYVHAVRTLRTLMDMGQSTIRQLAEHFNTVLRAKQEEMRAACLIEYQRQQQAAKREWLQQRSKVHHAAAAVYQQYPKAYKQVHRTPCL